MADREELAAILDALEPSSDYRVSRTLKDSPGETTQLVYSTADGQAGPFVRKIFSAGSGRGQAYESVYAAQCAGVDFRYQPRIQSFTQGPQNTVVVMEYLEGETLAQLVASRGPSGTLALDVGCKLCAALEELHGLNPPIIHRDIKPSNIIISKDRLSLIDLGIARTQKDGRSRDTVRLGTPGYAPPEQFGFGQTDTKSDIYAVGKVVAFCLLGEVCSDDLRSRGFNDRRIPPELQAVLAKACAFDPQDRFATAKDMHLALLQASKGKLPKGCALPAENQRFGLLGRIWNGLLVAAWIFLLLADAVGMNLQGAKISYPFWLYLLSNVCMLMVPAACAVYLLMDKRRLRRRFVFLYTLSRRRELLICLLIAALSIALPVAVAILGGFAA